MRDTPTPQPDLSDRELLLSLCASLTLCDHMGDVSNYVYPVLKRLKMPSSVLNADWEDLGKELGKLGVKTIWGTLVNSRI